MADHRSAPASPAAQPLHPREGTAEARPAAEAPAPAAVGLRLELPRRAPAAVLAPTFGWVRASAGERVLARGECARREASDAAGADRLLRELSRPGQVAWLDGDAAPEPPGPWLAALAFDADAPLDGSWAGFAPARLVLPELLCWSHQGRHWAAAFAPAHGRDEAAREALSRRLDALRAAVAAAPEGVPASLPPPAGALPGASAAARASWSALVGEALRAIREGSLDKVVVARAQDVRGAAPFDGARLLELLAERHPTCRAFLTVGDARGAHQRAPFFVGATPELLCSIDGRELRTEAVAGSSPPHEASHLLGSQKDLREHRWVVEHLVRGLTPLCDSVSLPPEPGLRVLTHVAHLVTPVAARLRPGVGPAEVVAALHPTPAVCGEPAGAALRFLARHEGLGRGLYAGLVGLVGERRTELAVALRSALVRGSEARVFAGAGLVEGSEADEELRETDLKTAALLQALAACAPLERPA